MADQHLMLILYSTGGSHEIQLVRQIPLEESEILKRSVCRILKQAGQADAENVLQSNSFQLWEGTNGFGDEFEFLYLRADIKAYLEFEKQNDDRSELAIYRHIAQGFERTKRIIRFIAVDVDIVNGDDIDAVSTPNPKITSAFVERALTDAALLISGPGATSSLDRVHTAFHGYLKVLCQTAGLAVGEDPSITELFKILRREHPAFQTTVSGGAEAQRILGAMAAIVDSLNPLRNHRSLAHPTEDLLEEPEAMLAVNAVRTLLHYLNSKIHT